MQKSRKANLPKGKRSRRLSAQPQTRKRTQTKSPKYIFVTGGVVSSIGKGLSAASLSTLLEACGLKVSMMKCDPYLNVDPGTMSPFQHGEVYVTEDGAETDLDLGHYERFTSLEVQRRHSVSSGQIYDSVIKKERKGDYLGGTVQVIPHVTDEIKERIRASAEGYDICIVEIGGTIGDIEGLPFVEAIRQMRADEGVDNTIFVHVTYVPYIKAAGELKSKPTQHSVKELREIGIQPDFLICRSEHVIDQALRKKIGLFCSVNPEHVIAAYDADSIYEVPLMLHAEKFDQRVLARLGILSPQQNLKPWRSMVNRLKTPKTEVNIAIVGKYVELKESYKSLHEALVHSGIFHRAQLNLFYIDSEKLNSKNLQGKLEIADGILVPGGFGERGVAGKILAIQYARTQKIPFFGICLGLQLSAIEFARHVCGVADASSREFESYRSKNYVIDYMSEQKDITDKGGTMRLGSYDCELKDGSKALKAYKQKKIKERHRHRFEFNNDYLDLLERNGMIATGMNRQRNLVEIFEVLDHPWFVSVQFHPEFKSRPLSPHPLFSDFVSSSLKHRSNR